MRKGGILFDRRDWAYRITVYLTLTVFLVVASWQGDRVYAQNANDPNIVALGMRLSSGSSYTPVLLRGVRVYAENPFRFDFLLDSGDAVGEASWLRAEAGRLIKYFLVALTIPENDLWVNLAPYEKEGVATKLFRQTKAGYDLAAQDYLFKQLAVSMLDLESAVGKEFWAKVYAEAYSKYGTTDIPVDTFNKIWIVPDRAEVFESAVESSMVGGQAQAFVTDMHLKVILQVDPKLPVKVSQTRVPTIEQAIRDHRRLSRQDVPRRILHEVVIPVLEKEINEGAQFARLRQICHSVILATWYKRKVKATLLSAVYFDQEKLEGVAASDQHGVEDIWEQYVDLFEKGARNYIKEERYQFFGDVVPRKFFTGGISCNMSLLTVQGTVDKAVAASRGRPISKVDVHLSALFQRGFRFGINADDLFGQFYDAYSRLSGHDKAKAASGPGKLELLLALKQSARPIERDYWVGNDCAYMGYAALIGALVTHFTSGEEWVLLAKFMLSGPVAAYFRYVAGDVNKVANYSAFFVGSVSDAVGGYIPSAGDIMAIGHTGQFFSIMPPGALIDEDIVMPAGEIWTKRDFYNAEFTISENIASEIARQMNMPRWEMLERAYGYLMSEKMGFHDYSNLDADKAGRKGLGHGEQGAIMLANLIASTVIKAIPDDLREQEAVLRKLTMKLLSKESAGMFTTDILKAGRSTPPEIRLALERYLHENVLPLTGRDYVVGKCTGEESWLRVYGLALAMISMEYYRDPDVSLNFIYNFGLSGDARKSIRIVEQRSAEVGNVPRLAWVGLKVGQYSQGFVDSRRKGGVYGNALQYNVSPETLQQFRATVGFDPVILKTSVLQSLSRYLKFVDN